MKESNFVAKLLAYDYKKSHELLNEEEKNDMFKLRLLSILQK